MSHCSRPTRLAILVLLALSSNLFLVRERTMKQLGDFLVDQDTLKPADVIHVIAGEDFRTDYAFQLYKEGYGKTVFFTGGWCHHHNYDHGTHAREVAATQGIPASAIADDNFGVMSTYMEAIMVSGLSSSARPRHLERRGFPDRESTAVVDGMPLRARSGGATARQRQRR